MGRYLLDFTIIRRILIRVQIHPFSLMILFNTEQYYSIQNDTIPHKRKTEMLFKKDDILGIVMRFTYIEGIRDNSKLESLQ